MDYDNTSLLESSAVRWSATALLVLLALFLLALTVSEIRAFKFIGGGVPVTNVVTVSGEGEVFAVPDIATFSVSVAEESLTAKAAQEAAAEKINRVIEFLRDNDVEERDIKTTNFSLFPRYEFTQVTCIRFPCPPGERTLKGFEVNQTVTVKVRDTDKAGELLSGVSEFGASSISGLNFTIDDEDELMAEARKMAIDDAREKAKQLADDLNVSLVRVVSFSEFGDDRFPRFGFAEASVDFAAVGGSLAPEIPVGENKIISNVNITYEIR